MADEVKSNGELVLDLRVKANDIRRSGTPIDVQLTGEDSLLTRSAGELGTVVSLSALDGPASGKRVPVQLAPEGRLTWLLEAPLDPGEARRYRCTVEKVRGGRMASPSDNVTIRLAGDHVWFTHAGQLLTRYVYMGNWKPYFWPIWVQAGNVVRGSSSEHQHQTGLLFAYGGHGGEGTTNIWSDWDEPPYGPCGKIVHRGFDRLEGGPVYGRLAERVTYTRPDGPRLFSEVRDVRIFLLEDGNILFDIVRHAERPLEAGPWPFLLSARIADSMRLVDLRQRDDQGIAQPIEKPGHLNAPDTPRLITPANATYRAASPWLDWSGPVGDGIAGLAFFDHPANPGREHGITAGGYGCMTLSHEHPGGETAVFRYAALAHDGDTDEAGVAHRYHDYVEAPSVDVDVLHRRPKPEHAH